MQVEGGYVVTEPPISLDMSKSPYIPEFWVLVNGRCVPRSLVRQMIAEGAVHSYIDTLRPGVTILAPNTADANHTLAELTKEEECKS